MSGPDFTRPALWEDVLELARKLDRHGARGEEPIGVLLQCHGMRDGLSSDKTPQVFRHKISQTLSPSRSA